MRSRSGETSRCKESEGKRRLGYREGRETRNLDDTHTHEGGQEVVQGEG